MTRSKYLALFLASSCAVAFPRRADAQTRRTTRPTATPAASPAPTSSASPAPAASPSPTAVTNANATNANVPPPPPVSGTPPTMQAVADLQASSENARTLTLDDALRIARHDPPAILSSIARIRAAEAQIPLVQATLIPVLTGSVSGSIGATNGFQSFGGTAVSASNFTASASTGVTGRWTIWDFGRTSLNVDAARLNVEATRADAANTLRLAVSQAAVAYFTALADQELVASAAETLRQRQREADIAHGLVDAGARPPVESTRADVAVDAAQLDLINATTATQNDLASLAAALAIDPTAAIAVQHPHELAVDDDSAHAAAEAERSRPELNGARLALQRAEVQLSAVRANYRPSVTANASISAALGFNYRFATDVAPATQLLAPSEQGQAVLGLTIPLFDPVTNANIRIAEANVAVARAALVEQVLAVRTDAVQAAILLRSARQSLAQAERLAAGAAANLAQAQGRYEAGAAPLLELVDAQAADATARVAVVRARWQFELAKVRLLAAVGHLDTLGGQ